MSLQDVRELVSELPRTLQDQVIGYAESVERCLPDIFREAGQRQTDRLSREVVFIAGVKKLQWLASSSYWTLSNSGELLKTMDVFRVRIGRTDVSKGSAAYTELKALSEDLDKALREENVAGYLWLSWPELVQELASNGHQ